MLQPSDPCFSPSEAFTFDLINPPRPTLEFTVDVQDELFITIESNQNSALLQLISSSGEVLIQEEVLDAQHLLSLPSPGMYDVCLQVSNVVYQEIRKCELVSVSVVFSRDQQLTSELRQPTPELQESTATIAVYVLLLIALLAIALILPYRKKTHS